MDLAKLDCTCGASTRKAEDRTYVGMNRSPFCADMFSWFLYIEFMLKILLLYLKITIYIYTIQLILHHKIDKFGLSNFSHIHSPVSFSFSRSNPVSNPAYFKANATFSVHTFPTGFIE